MVKGVLRVKRQFDQVGKFVRDEVTGQIDKEAGKLVVDMRALCTSDVVRAQIEHDAAEAATMRARNGWAYGKIYARVYVRPLSDKRIADLPRWLEFGTKGRVQATTGRETGAATASPYFFPVYRANKKRIRANLSRAVLRALKKLNKA
jgi:hypothetical protein